MAGVSDQKVAGGREQALGWVSWAFANGKEGSVTWERDLGWWVPPPGSSRRAGVDLLLLHCLAWVIMCCEYLEN